MYSNQFFIPIPIVFIQLVLLNKVTSKSMYNLSRIILNSRSVNLWNNQSRDITNSLSVKLVKTRVRQ